MCVCVSVKVISLKAKINLFNPGTEVVKGVGVDVAAGKDGEEVVFGQRHLLPLDKVHALVLQRRRPVRVADQVAGEVLADDELLKNKFKK